MSLFSFTEMPEKLERLGGKIANASIWESNFIRVVAAALAVLLLAIVIAVPLDLVQQSVIAVIAFVAASKLRRLSWGRGGILIMIGISLLMTLRSECSQIIGVISWIPISVAFSTNHS